MGRLPLLNMFFYKFFPSTPTDAIQQLTDGITQWVGTLVNAILPPMTPTPAWYQQIKSVLPTSQQHSQSWLNDTAPNIIADMTTSFITYSSMFANVVKDVTPLLTQIAQQNNIPTADQVQQLTQLVTTLAQTAAAN